MLIRKKTMFDIILVIRVQTIKRVWLRMEEKYEKNIENNGWVDVYGTNG